MRTKSSTTGTCDYSVAMTINDPDKAREYFEALVLAAMRSDPELTWEQAIENERANIGYWASFDTPETRVRVERLFGATHRGGERYQRP